MDSLFPARPDDLAALSAEELGDLLASFQTVSRQLRAGEVDLAEVYPDLSESDRSTQVMEDWRDAAAYVQSIRSRQDELASELEEGARVADELHAAFGDEDEEAAEDAEAPVEGELAAAEADADEDDEDEDEAEDEADELAADEPAVVAAARIVRFPAVARKHEAPAVALAQRAQLVAAGGLADTQPGAPLDADAFARLMVETARRRGKVNHHEGGTRERILLASASFPFPEERILSGTRDEIREKVQAVIPITNGWGQHGGEALVASGGLCAPLTPFYDLPQLSTTARPVRDALPGFQAARGGISVPSVSTLSDAAGAITVIEIEDDAAGGSAATKSCLDMTCAEWLDVAVGIISHCRQYGNLNARAWPEGINHENENTMAFHARTAEGRLLDRIDSLSLELSRTAVYGAASSLLYALSISRVGIISRLRMDPNTRFRVILPFWAATAFSLDLVNSQYERFGTPPEQVAALFSRFGFNVVWHLDEGLEDAADVEIWPNETDGTAQEDWPGSVVIARVYPEGEFLYLDGGTLELGLVRDSTLNETNDHEMFGETFENVARIGPPQAAHRLEITVCPSGTVAAPATAITCSAT